MQPQQNPEPQSSAEQVCAQCGAPMPKEMRFCRACGHRLGEGPAEYTPTVRFSNVTGAASGATTPFYPGVNAPLAQQPATSYPKKRRLGFTGMTWLWIILGLFFLTGGVLSALRKNRPPSSGGISFTRPRSYFGVDGFANDSDKVTFKNVEPPGGPADKAGLVGGDIITSFDGQPVRNRAEMLAVLERTPIGKTVEIVYLRDGISHTAQMTTMSGDESDRLAREFRNRPEGRGMFGFESERMTPISDPQTKTFGVRIDYVQPNGPADLFGIKEGDIITDFDHVPIRTPDEFLSRVRRAIPRVPVEVAVLRDGKPLKIMVTIGRS